MSKVTSPIALKIVRYLNSRKTAATSKEIAKFTKCNANTVRKFLGSAQLQGTTIEVLGKRNCRVSGSTVGTYQPSI